MTNIGRDIVYALAEDLVKALIDNIGLEGVLVAVMKGRQEEATAILRSQYMVEDTMIEMMKTEKFGPKE